MKYACLKSTSEDFIVSESLVLPIFSETATNKYYYYFLEKCGYTTFEASEQLSAVTKIDRNTIGYAGLKDEDGITKQFISLPIELTAPCVAQFNNIHKNANGKFIKITYVGFGDLPIKIGELCGNSFKLIIRKLSREFAAVMLMHKHYSTFFINYYGTQRFGLPNAPKTTHLIGEHLINNNYAAALELLKEQPNTVGLQARASTQPQQFFEQLDKRLVAFYQSAYYSYCWNEMVKKIIAVACHDTLATYTDSNIDYYFSHDLTAKLKILQTKHNLEYRRVTPSSNGFTTTPLQRNILTQVNVQCNRIFVDDLNANHWAAEVIFFLPSGSYATIAIPQVLHELTVKCQQ